jgi:hypothetical protein
MTLQQMDRWLKYSRHRDFMVWWTGEHFVCRIHAKVLRQEREWNASGPVLEEVIDDAFAMWATSKVVR